MISAAVGRRAARTSDGVPDRQYGSIVCTLTAALGARFPLVEREPTKDDIDALVGPATPHFAYQLRARIRELIADLPEDHSVRRYGEEKMELLDRLGYASSKAEDLRPLPRDTGAGWEKIPSSAPASDPLPRNR